MNALRFRFLSLLAAAGILTGSSSASALATSHRSVKAIPVGNGRASIAFDVASSRLTQFLEHPYRFPQAGVESRNFLYDAYPGIRVGGQHTWLASVAPTMTEVIPGTGIIHVKRDFAGVTTDEYHFAPIDLPENAVFTIVRATRTSGTGNVDLYELFNYRLGTGSPLPSANNEGMQWNAARDAFYEYGYDPGHVAFAHGSVEASSHHGATPQNPYDSLNGGSDLADNAGPNGSTTDAVAGLQKSLGNLATGKSGAAGFYSVLDPSGSDAQGAADRVRAWIAGRSAEKILADETASWAKWIQPAPSGATSAEASLYKQSQANLRMAQVVEPGTKADGQLLAALAPGRWNIAWVRDMAYATVGLVKSGHAAEAKKAIEFQLGADAGKYAANVGSPYQISVVRYFGNGTEESDSNNDGPNIEYDGFGLFLWEVDQYVRASGDTASLKAWWPAIQDKVADVLVKLQEPSGLISPDSSIWEVHLKNDRHFAYTTETAALGLCSASHLATLNAAGTQAKAYQAAGEKARDAIALNLLAPDGTIGQSTEALAAGAAFLDAAALESINFGLVNPAGRAAKATVASIEAKLTPPSGRGFMRSDVGGWYDSQEWIFVDLRSTGALRAVGKGAAATSLFQWNVDQALDNFFELSELHERTTADYAGESPMIGFGAGAYAIALQTRAQSPVPACGAYAVEGSMNADAGVDAGPGTPPDAGTPDAGSGGGNDGGPVEDSGTKPDQDAGAGDAGSAEGPDAGSSGSTQDATDGGDATPSPPDSGGCAVSAVGSRSAGGAYAALAFLFASVLSLVSARKGRAR